MIGSMASMPLGWEAKLGTDREVDLYGDRIHGALLAAGFQTMLAPWPQRPQGRRWQRLLRLSAAAYDEIYPGTSAWRPSCGRSSPRPPDPNVDGLGIVPSFGYQLVEKALEPPWPHQYRSCRPGASEVRPDQPPEVTPDTTLDATLDRSLGSNGSNVSTTGGGTGSHTGLRTGPSTGVDRGFLRVPGRCCPVFRGARCRRQPPAALGTMVPAAAYYPVATLDR